MKKYFKTSIALALISSFGFIGSVQAQPKTDNAIRGLVVSDSEALLSSPMAGRLSHFYIKPGQKFDKGQTILRFECDENQAKHSMAQAELDSAVESQQAKMRMQGLSQASELEVKLASANVSRAEANVQLQSVSARNCSLRAPFNGKVSKINAKPYQGVQIGQPLVEFISDKNLNVKVNAPAKLATKLKVGDTLTIQVDETDKSYKAQIIAMNAKIDAVSQTFELEAKIKDTSNELLAGMSGNVSFEK